MYQNVPNYMASLIATCVFTHQEKSQIGINALLSNGCEQYIVSENCNIWFSYNSSILKFSPNIE